jgi:hypothetical protein
MRARWFLVAAMFLLGACSAEQKELGRQILPNQKLVAVLMESMSGGTAGSVQQDNYPIEIVLIRG